MPVHRSPFISAEELTTLLLENREVSVLDASFVLPTSNDDPRALFEQKHIPGAQFFDIEDASDPTSDLPHMMPSAGLFGRYAGSLGVGNSDTVAIYGQGNTAMGPARAWWMFKAFGHEKVYVLDGGLQEWLRTDGVIESGAPSPAPCLYVAQEPERDLVKSLEVMKVLHSSVDVLVLDARPTGRFDGSVPEPRSGLRSGHIPGSFNIPAGALLDPDTGLVKDEDSLREICAAALETPNKEIVTTCGSGMTACMIALALYHLEGRFAALYDGSWSEWGKDSIDTPVVQA